MKQELIRRVVKKFQTAIALGALGLLLVTSYSFTMRVIGMDFLKELGMSKTEAEQKIARSILGGYLDQYGVRNAKNIAMGNRAAVVKDLLTFTKKYVGTPAFVKQYNDLRETEKPTPPEPVKTPDELQQSLIEQSKKAVAECEANLKKADPSMKKIFEDVLASARSNLKAAEDPGNKTILSYRKNYPELVKITAAGEKQQLANWEKKYPTNHMVFVKGRLMQFLEETEDIDFGAELYEKNGKKYFKNPVYEGKSNRWKMGFRAGKEVVEPARVFVQEWVGEIK